MPKFQLNQSLLSRGGLIIIINTIIENECECMCMFVFEANAYLQVCEFTSL